MSARMCRIAVATLASVCIGSGVCAAQAQIKVNDDVNIKFGVLGQVQADALEDSNSDDYAKNFFLRRIRLLVGGSVAKNVSFFIETDAPNLGKTVSGGKAISPSVIVQDAYGEFMVSRALIVDGGLMFVPFSRDSLQSAATLLQIDYGSYTFSQSAPIQSINGRDAGFQGRGYFLDNHLEYRIGVFQGLRDTLSHNAFRYTGRVQYNVLETEDGFFYTGTYLGKKKILAIGGAFDAQEDYHGFDVDLFVDHPAGPGAVTGQFSYNRFDGDVFLPTLPKQDDLQLELGYFLSRPKITPVLQYVQRGVVDAASGDESRVSIGLNYWWAGHNANVKGAYTRINPSGAKNQNEFTIQVQFFYY
jgi:hypothetical protein